MNTNSKRLICVVVCVLLLVVFMVVGISRCSGKNDPTPVAPTEKYEETVPVQSEETIMAVPGVMHSPFDEVTETVQPTENEEETTPTEKATEPTEKATEPTEKATEPTEKATEPTEKATEPTEKVTEPAEESELTAYETYLKMSPAEQTAFFNSFDSVEAYIAWYNKAKAEYEALHPGIDAGNGSFDFGDLDS